MTAAHALIVRSQIGHVDIMNAFTNSYEAQETADGKEADAAAASAAAAAAARKHTKLLNKEWQGQTQGAHKEEHVALGEAAHFLDQLSYNKGKSVKDFVNDVSVIGWLSDEHVNEAKKLAAMSEAQLNNQSALIALVRDDCLRKLVQWRANFGASTATSLASQKKKKKKKMISKKRKKWPDIGAGIDVRHPE